MDYGYVLKRAWEIIWKFKILWIFGILAGFWQAGSSGGGNSGFRISSQDRVVFPEIQNFFNQLGPGEVTLLIILAIAIIVVLVVVAVVLGAIGRVGLIRGTLKAEQGASKLTFSELWREGLAFFWRVFGLNLLIALIVGFSVFILAPLGVILSIGTLGIILICLIPLLCLLIPLAWLVGILIEQANVALVVENVDIIEAIKRGWQVFIDHIGSMIVMGLILIIGVSVIGGLIIGLPLIAIAAPAALGITTGVFENARTGILISIVLFLIYLPFLLVFSGILRGYTQSAWTLTYLRLTRPPMPPMPLEAPPAAPLTEVEPPPAPQPAETPPAPVETPPGPPETPPVPPETPPNPTGEGMPRAKKSKK